jgi:hypothetical protein
MVVYHVIQTLLILHFTNSFLISRAWELDYEASPESGRTVATDDEMDETI